MRYIRTATRKGYENHIHWRKGYRFEGTECEDLIEDKRTGYIHLKESCQEI